MYVMSMYERKSFKKNLQITLRECILVLEIAISMFDMFFDGMGTCSRFHAYAKCWKYLL